MTAAWTRPARVSRAAADAVRRMQWRRNAKHFYAQFVAGGDLCFDVGAHVGERTAIFRSLGARVVAVEPQHHCADDLEQRFPEPEVTVLRSALGARPGEGRLRPGTADTTSSLSVEWIESVIASRRFADLAWGDPVLVPVTTLDDVIGRFGVPTFCKIDVEGYEREVVEGLSRPIRTLSFEFTPEFLAAAAACLARLSSLGEVEFNYATGEVMRLQLTRWVPAEVLLETLRTLPAPDIFGDVYARFRV